MKETKRENAYYFVDEAGDPAFYDLPPKKWTLRRSGGSINTSLKTTGGVQWMGRIVSISGLTGILSFQR